MIHGSGWYVFPGEAVSFLKSVIFQSAFHNNRIITTTIGGYVKLAGMEFFIQIRERVSAKEIAKTLPFFEYV